MPKLLLDTNVLVDYLMGREPGCSAAKRIFELASSESGDPIAVYASALSLKDVYYIVTATLKRESRIANGGMLPAGAAAAASAIGWSCVEKVMDLALIAPVGTGECLSARTLRALHDDFEDDLVVATAQNCKADFLVTGDEALLRHCPLASLSPADMAALLETQAG